jgi:hypothetical protein
MTNTEDTAALAEESNAGAVLRSDAMGRVRTPAARRRELLEEFERSGLSGKKFAALVGVKYSTFAFWLQDRRRRERAGRPPKEAADTVRWLEAVVEKAQSGGVASGALVLALPGGARMEVGDAHQAVLAAALLRSLAQPC